MNASKLGLELHPGDAHYRAYVGPPKDYDLVAAMVFNLMTCLGLRQHHRVVDIGCGSLRVGRLLIPYLNEGGYIGVEPNNWLVRDGIENEIGNDLIRIKAPSFVFDDKLSGVQDKINANFMVAQSIFSHCGIDLIRNWLQDVSHHLADDGVFVATFLTDSVDFSGNGWVYPGCVNFTPATLGKLGQEYGLSFRMLDWAHPRQTWCIYWKTGANTTLFEDGAVSWNRFVKSNK